MTKKVLYLLGAGATHAEVINSSDEINEEKYGLHAVVGVCLPPTTRALKINGG